MLKHWMRYFRSYNHFIKGFDFKDFEGNMLPPFWTIRTMAKELIIFFLILHCVLAKDIKAISGQRIDLKCKLNSTQEVSWYIDIGKKGPDFTHLYSCPYDQTGSCDKESSVNPLYEDRSLQVQRGNGTSILSLIPFKDETFQCHLGNHLVEAYSIFVIDPTNIKEYCNDSLPSISQNGDYQILLSCGITFRNGLNLDADLNLGGLGQNNFDIQESSTSIKRTLPLDDNFNNINDANCEIYFPEINITLTCAHPAIIKTKYVVEGNGIIVQSDDESDVDWQLFGNDGTEEDISSRSWTRNEGRSLLIRGITEEDAGKVVVWRTKGAENQTNNGTIGFTVISEIPEDSKINDPKNKNPALPNDDGPFFVLALLFLALWLITFVVGGIILFCREKKCKTSTSGNAKSLNSNQCSNVRPNENGGSGENGTPLVRFTTEATNPDISNTNNSAHIPVLERDDSNDDTLNRQSQGNSHLYFTLEKSPSASFRRASAPRWTHGDASTATLDQDQDILWQGYATVGDSNENATCSYDLGEYAEVGEHLIQGKGPPVQSVRPPVRKKPGREEVKEDDTSKLYGKVNK